jgi:hypothetical protein
MTCNDSSEPKRLSFFFLKAPTHSNANGAEKLRKDEWLISAILREISQLKRRSAAFADGWYIVAPAANTRKSAQGAYL